MAYFYTSRPQLCVTPPEAFWFPLVRSDTLRFPPPVVVCAWLPALSISAVSLQQPACSGAVPTPYLVSPIRPWPLWHVYQPRMPPSYQQ